MGTSPSAISQNSLAVRSPALTCGSRRLSRGTPCDMPASARIHLNFEAPKESPHIAMQPLLDRQLVAGSWIPASLSTLPHRWVALRACPFCRRSRPPCTAVIEHSPHVLGVRLDARESSWYGFARPCLLPRFDLAVASRPCSPKQSRPVGSRHVRPYGPLSKIRPLGVPRFRPHLPSQTRQPERLSLGHATSTCCTTVSVLEGSHLRDGSSLGRLAHVAALPDEVRFVSRCCRSPEAPCDAPRAAGCLRLPQSPAAASGPSGPRNALHPSKNTSPGQLWPAHPSDESFGSRPLLPP